MKRFFALALSLALCFSLSACGEDTLESVIEDARDFIEDIDSVHCAVLTSMDMVENEESLTSYLSMSADLDLENDIYYLKMASSSGEDENILMDIYITMGDTIDYYLCSNNKWMKMTNVDAEALKGMDLNTDVRRDFEVYFKALLESPDATMVEDEIEGEALYRLHAPVKITSLDMAKDFTLDAFIVDMLGENATDEMIDALLNELGAVDVVVYIRRDTYEPYGFMLDAKPALETLYKNINKTDIVVNEACTYSVYTQYDDIEEIVLPEAARLAPDISSMQQ